MDSVDIYTDGACSGNPGKGAWAAIIQKGKETIKLSEGYKRTTNNRMELMGAVCALEFLKEKHKIHLFTDSEYVSNSYNKDWYKKWFFNRKTFPNIDLWARFRDEADFHELTITWVKGHSHTEMNRICDEMAVEARSAKVLSIDEEYMKSLRSK